MLERRAPSRRREDCLFCKIVAGELPAVKVLADDVAVAFLDRTPLFHGHTLLVPRGHVETLLDLPDALIDPFFRHARRLTGAIQRAMRAEGSFVAINNRISQSVPHLHVHIVPRRKGDGLRGFFWPRRKYGEGEAESTAAAIRAELAEPDPTSKVPAAAPS